MGREELKNWPDAEFPTTYSRAQIEAFTHRRDLRTSLHPALPTPPTPTTHQISAPSSLSVEDMVYLSQETGIAST